MLVGGFPCQSFSIAGQRRGFNDTRGTQFFNIARIIRVKQPRFLLLENVKGLLSHDKGETFLTIISTLDELGYDVEWQVLNSKNHGVPQNRERVFIIGRLRGFGGRKVFPLGASHKEDSRTTGLETSYCLDANYSKGTNTIHKGRRQLIKQLNNPTHSNDRLYDQEGLSPSLNTAQGGNRQPKIPEGSRIRRLTPVECERLQGFSDQYTKHGLFDGEKKEISDTQRYKMLGNAVTTNVIRDIMKEVLHTNLVHISR